MNPTDTVINWVLGAGLAGFIGVFSYLAKKVSVDLGEQLKGMGSKLDTLIATQAHGDTRMSVLESKVETMSNELERMRERIHEHGNHIASMQAKQIIRQTGSYPKVGQDND